MNFGIPIDNRFLRTLPEYKDKPESELTAVVRSNVALQRKNEYVGDAERYVDGLKQGYGNGVSTLCRFYNASGDPIRVRIAHSWAGRFCEREAASIVENGQWTAFLHVHPTGTRRSNVGIEDTDIFFGWRNPWFAIDGTCCTEIREKDHWWSVGSERDMLHLLEENVGSKDQSVQRYKSVIELEGARCVATIEKA